MKKAQGKFTATKTGPRIDRFPFEVVKKEP